MFAGEYRNNVFMNKTTSLYTIILTALLSLSAYSNEFKFNNKNLNALMALVCQSSLQHLNNDSIYAHKLSVDKTKLGAKTDEATFELSGTCNVEYDTKTKEILAYGDEFSIEINMMDTSQATGKIGIKDIALQFKNKELIGLAIKDPLMLTQKAYRLTNSKWAQSDSIFSFNSKKTFLLKIGRKTAALEENTDLTFKGKLHTKFFNTWSYEAFGCSSKTAYISNKVCSKIVSKMK